ncbi:MAG TPA: ABC transporter permease [Solirubrobacterales bacterium]|nr:ABC transporter permease [Solirubrobacterales bacterium]
MSTTEAHAADHPELVLAPPGRWDGLRLGELWAHRELIYFLTKRELQIRYKQSVFGISWAVLQPLVFAFIFALFFGLVLKVKVPGDIPYPVFAVAGIVPWQFTAQAINAGASSLVLDSNLISKVYFPRLALPISKALGLILDLMIALVVVVVVTLAYGVSISSMVYLVPAFLLLGVVTAFALATLLSALNVKYRDVQVLIPMLVQILFFASPVLYSGAIVGQSSGEAWSYLYYVNPMASVLDGTRWALLDQPAPSAAKVLISIGSASLLLVGAVLYFRRAEQFFADVI